MYSTIGNGWGPDVTIDTIYNSNYCGIVRKVIATKDTFGNIQRKLIEGLGSEFGFIAYSYDPGFENGAFTKCIKFNGTVLYGDSSLNCDLPLGIYDIDKRFNIRVYPNPTRNKINIELDKTTSENYTLELKSICGNSIFKRDCKDANETIDIENFTSGIYILIIKNSDRTYTQRIIKE
ncbi:MAG: T9SS type A sorting domain-containing protein [Bacteroidota bacterium]|nr:MAG: T9SS type A sorting domain-containing protein [Bacteroidota bacterium]